MYVYYIILYSVHSTVYTIGNFQFLFLVRVYCKCYCEKGKYCITYLCVLGLSRSSPFYASSKWHFQKIEKTWIDLNIDFPFGAWSPISDFLGWAKFSCTAGFIIIFNFKRHFLRTPFKTNVSRDHWGLFCYDNISISRAFSDAPRVLRWNKCFCKKHQDIFNF